MPCFASRRELLYRVMDRELVYRTREAGNPYSASIGRFFEHQSLLTGLYLELRTRLKHLAALAQPRVEAWAMKDPDGAVLGSNLYVQDLTARGSEPRYLLTGHQYDVSPAKYLEVESGLARWVGAWVVAQSFEGFESFVKDVAAQLVVDREDLPGLNKREKWERLARNRGKPSVDWASFESAREAIPERQCLPLIRAAVPQLREIEEKNDLGLQLQTWLRVAADVRNAATHGGGVISGRVAARMGPSRWELLRSLFSCEMEEGQYRLVLHPEEVERAAETFRAYAYLIYATVCEVA